LNWRTLPQEYRTVLASGFARVVKHFLSGPFGIMSAFKSNRSPDQNNESNRLLKRKLQELGYGFIPGRGVWVGAPEKSLFIVGIDQPSLQKLSEEFGQQSYVIGDEGKYKIVDTNSGDLWGKGNTKDDFHQFSEEEVKGMESGPSEKKNYSRSKGRTWIWDPKYRDRKVQLPEQEQEQEQESEGEEPLRARAVYYGLSPEVKYAMPRSGQMVVQKEDGHKIVGSSRTLDAGNLDVLIPLRLSPSDDWVMNNCRRFGR
jgi:hypothetical protein